MTAVIVKTHRGYSSNDHNRTEKVLRHIRHVNGELRLMAVGFL